MHESSGVVWLTHWRQQNQEILCLQNIDWEFVDSILIGWCERDGRRTEIWLVDVVAENFSGKFESFGICEYQDSIIYFFPSDLMDLYSTYYATALFMIAFAFYRGKIWNCRCGNLIFQHDKSWQQLIFVLFQPKVRICKLGFMSHLTFSFNLLNVFFGNIISPEKI